MFTGLLYFCEFAKHQIPTQLKSTLAASAANLEFQQDGFELISRDPIVASLKMLYYPGFAAPGSTVWLIEDETHSVSELGKYARAMELAISVPNVKPGELFSCHFETEHIFGTYYFARSYDVDNCEPD